MVIHNGLALKRRGNQPSGMMLDGHKFPLWTMCYPIDCFFLITAVVTIAGRATGVCITELVLKPIVP